MTPPITLSIYISRQFAGAVVGMLLALSGLVALFDFIELLRRSTSKPDATFGLVSEIAVLRLPYVSMQVLPFAVLLGGMLCFWRLTRSSELIVARASGVSAWEFEPELEIANCFVEARTEIEFFDSECSVLSNLPLPKQNEVYYWESKIYDKPDTSMISIGVATKPYPLFRLPGMFGGPAV